MAFSVSVIINAVDVSLKIKGLLSVKGKEGAARIARFTINPDPGVIDPYSYIGKPVTINFIDGTSDRIFTGIATKPSYSIYTGLLSFVCTDNLQEEVELVDRAAVDLLLPVGYWDKAVFNDPTENWSYSQQRMSTYPGSFNKDVNGAVVITDWQPKAIPDFTFTDSTIVDKSLDISALAERRSITNSIKITFQNRYQRLWQRELSGSWALGMTFDAWLLDPTDLPTKQMVEQAASGWTKKAISFTDLLPSGMYSGVSWNLSLYAQTLCQGASIAVAKRWKQNITDTYTITVQSAASITQHGLLEVEQKHSLTADDNSSFAEFKEYKAPTGTLVEAGNYVELTALSPNNAILTAVNVAKTKILASHRNNRITFKTALDASIDTDKTVRVNHTKAQATGKVSSVTHEIDLLAGRAITTCTIAVYSPNIAAQTDDALTVPTSPYTDPSGLVGTLPALNSYLGNVDLAPVEDPNWNGFIGNYEEWTGTPPAPEFYNERFSFEIPAITDTAAVDYAGISSFNVAIPQNELVVIK